MTDHLTPEKRSWNMSRIKGKDTSIEFKVRKYLFKYGFRYRKNVKELPGKPDIVMPKYKTVIFIHGCFWHRHAGCKRATMPKSRVDYWETKFAKNVENDRTHKKMLEAAGWKVITVWECEINHKFEETIDNVIKQIKRN